jgi:hypothetical protein
MRERDYAYEALAEATGCDMEASRGELNVALKKIREQEPDTTSYGLADEIHRRARLYREVMGDGILLTPPALAKHWRRVAEEASRPKGGTNLRAADTHCSLCGGDRFVVVGSRAAKETDWMRAHSVKVSEGAVIEEVAPCPECNPVEVTFLRHDGSRFSTPDAGKTLELLQR